MITIDEAAAGIQKYLAMVAEMRGRSKAVEQFVLDRGRAWAWAPKPKGWAYRMGVQKQCFKNAFVLTQRAPGLRYVEGWAVRLDLGVPMHHAWCVTEDGLVVDNTWRIKKGEPVPMAAYFGVAFSDHQVIKFLLETKVYGIYFNRSLRYLEPNFDPMASFSA